MANYILQELPQGMSDGKKVVFPRIDNYDLLDYRKFWRRYTNEIPQYRKALYEVFWMLLHR